MTFSESIITCFANYANFKGRATRSEYWWFYLFYVLIFVALRIMEHAHIQYADIIEGIFSLAMLLPTLAVGTRRLHDTNRSGWFQLLFFIPIIGMIILIVWLAQKSDEGSNRFDIQNSAT